MQDSTDFGQIRDAGSVHNSRIIRVIRSFGWYLCRPYFFWLVNRLRKNDERIDQLKQHIERLQLQISTIETKGTDKIAVAEFLHSVEAWLSRMEQVSKATSNINRVQCDKKG